MCKIFALVKVLQKLIVISSGLVCPSSFTLKVPFTGKKRPDFIIVIAPPCAAGAQTKTVCKGKREEVRHLETVKKKHFGKKKT